MTMATIKNEDDLELIAEHPALKISFLLSCSASHSLNPLVNRYHYIQVVMMVTVMWSMMAIIVMMKATMVMVMVTVMLSMKIPVRLVRKGNRPSQKSRQRFLILIRKELFQVPDQENTEQDG